MISENIAASSKTQFSWAEPIPLIHEYEQSLPYPVQCLPSLIKEAIIAYHQYAASTICTTQEQAMYPSRKFHR